MKWKSILFSMMTLTLLFLRIHFWLIIHLFHGTAGLSHQCLCWSPSLFPNPSWPHILTFSRKQCALSSSQTTLRQQSRMSTFYGVDCPFTQWYTWRTIRAWKSGQLSKRHQALLQYLKSDGKIKGHFYK
jgi:hypothetical protein